MPFIRGTPFYTLITNSFHNFFDDSTNPVSLHVKIFFLKQSLIQLQIMLAVLLKIVLLSVLSKLLSMQFMNTVTLVLKLPKTLSH